VRKQSDLIWAIILIAVGSVLLLDQVLHVNLWKLLWPLFLIGLGLYVLWSASRTETAPQGEAASIPLEGLTQARVSIHHGAGRLDLGRGDDPDALLSGVFMGGLEVRRRDRGGVAGFDLKPSERGSAVLLFPHLWRRGLDWQVRLNPEVSYALEVESGLTSSALDLEGLTVSEFALKTGLSSCAVTLPAMGVVRAQVESGLGAVELRLPEGVAASIRVEVGLGSASVDEARFPRVGENAYRSPEYDYAVNRVELAIKTGLGSVTVK